MREELKDELIVLKASYPEIDVDVSLAAQGVITLSNVTPSVFEDDAWFDEFDAYTNGDYADLRGEWMPKTHIASNIECFVPAEYPDEPLSICVTCPFAPKDGSRLSEWMDMMQVINSSLEESFTEGYANMLMTAVDLVRQNVHLDYLWISLESEAAEEQHRKELQDEGRLERGSPKKRIAHEIAEEITKALPNTSTYSENLGIEIIHGEYLTERKSTFQSHYARVCNLDEIQDVQDTLWAFPHIARACHNMTVYRLGDRTEPDRYTEDYDSDGENEAGGRLMHLFRAADVEPNTYIMVTRWFGGILLGPSRFRLINNSARKLLVDNERIPEKKSKKKK